MAHLSPVLARSSKTELAHIRSMLVHAVYEHPDEPQHVTALIEHLAPHIKRYFTFHGLHDTAEELTQKALVRITSKMRDHSIRAESLTNFVSTVISNLAKNEYRRIYRENKWHTSLDVVKNTPSHEEIHTALEHQELMESYREAIRDLPEEQQSAFTLWLDGEQYASIATQLHTPIGTVKSRVNRTKKILQEALKIYR